MWYERTIRPFGDSGWYEQPKARGMGALGWSEYVTGASAITDWDFWAGRGQLTDICSGATSLAVCALPSEANFMQAQGCSAAGSSCSTGVGSGNLRCCPPSIRQTRTSGGVVGQDTKGGGATPSGGTPGGSMVGTTSCQRTGTGGTAYWYGVQEALCRMGYSFPRFGIDGRTGTETEGVIRQFQASRGLPQTGRVDAATAAALQTTAQPSGGGGGGTRQPTGTTPGTTPPAQDQAGILSQFFDPRNPLLWLTIAGVVATVGGTVYYYNRRSRSQKLGELSDTGLEREIYQAEAAQSEQRRMVVPTPKRRR